MSKSDISQGRRGRPLGFKLSDSSKRAISESKKGQRHKQTTKDKISSSLIRHFKSLNPLSEELTNMYCDYENGDIEVCRWMATNEENLDAIDDVMTLKSLRNANRIEITAGYTIEFFSHEITPELLVLFMERCEELGIDPDELFDQMSY